MHILLSILGALGAAAFYWYRLQNMSAAANDAINTVGRVRGHFRRKKLRAKAAESPVSAIDDPVVAAATILVSIHGEDSPLTPQLEGKIRDVVYEIAASDGALDEAMTYAKWAASQVVDVPLVIDRAGKFLDSRLNEVEKEQLISMVDKVAEKSGQRPKLHKIRTDKLRQKLGLTVH